LTMALDHNLPQGEKLISSPRTVGICGLGQIGLPLTLACWRSGFKVCGYDVHHQKLETALQDLHALDEWMKREIPELVPHYGSIEFTPDLATLNREADLVVECIWEDMDQKVALLRSLSGAASRGAAFCTSTSGLSVSEMGNRSGLSRQLVGTHFWTPPHLMPLVEVVVGSGTTEETVEIASQFCRKIGKRPVRVNIDAPGFIGNRMLHALWREAIHIVERGIASPEDVDAVAKLTFGLRQSVLGPMEHMDLAGLDLVHAIQGYLLRDLAANPHPNKLLQEMFHEQQLGVKTRQGFYDWTKRDPAALVQARDHQIVRELKRLIKERTDEGSPDD